MRQDFLNFRVELFVWQHFESESERVLFVICGLKNFPGEFSTENLISHQKLFLVVIPRNASIKHLLSTYRSTTSKRISLVILPYMIYRETQTWARCVVIRRCTAGGCYVIGRILNPEKRALRTQPHQ